MSQRDTLHQSLWTAFKNGYAAGMDHDPDHDSADFGDAAEQAFAEDYPALHARCVEDWRKPA